MDAPERIWAWWYYGTDPDNYLAISKWDTEPSQNTDRDCFTQAEYIRADVVAAQVAAARREALEAAAAEADEAARQLRDYGDAEGAEIAAKIAAAIRAMKEAEPSNRALWAGDPTILPVGAEVEILARDEPNDACWIRWSPAGSRVRFRSCDLSDLEMKEADNG